MPEKSSVDPTLEKLVEDYRGLLPPGFHKDVMQIEADLASETAISEWRARSAKPSPEAVADGSANIALRNAILKEISLFVCSDHSRYADVRNKGRELSAVTVSMMAGYIAASIGISLGVATAAVGFVALAVSRVAIGTFCRLCPPPADKTPKNGSRSSGRPRKGMN